MSMDFDSPEEAREFFEGVADNLYGTLIEIYDILTEIDPTDRSPRVDNVVQILYEVLDLDEDNHPCPQETLHTPWETEEEVDVLLSPILKDIWKKNIATLGSCQGYIAEDECDVHKHHKGYIAGRTGYSTLVQDVTEILNKHRCANIEVETPGDNIWVVKFDAIDAANG